jgi:hypothetical protein
MSKKSDFARISLGLIRLVNGAIALVSPQIITRRFTDSPPPVAVYALRMFGIRTVLVALDLMRHPGPDRRHATKVAPLIHASDLTTAILISRAEGVPKSTGRLIVAISALNTVLALLSRDKPPVEA